MPKLMMVNSCGSFISGMPTAKSTYASWTAAAVLLIRCRGTGAALFAINSMDRQKIVDQLARAEEQIASCAQFIAQQRAVIAKLEEDGHEIGSAGALLTQFLLLQALHEAECARLLQLLADHVQR